MSFVRRAVVLRRIDPGVPVAPASRECIGGLDGNALRLFAIWRFHSLGHEEAG
jgi:hypothetical protein